MNGTTIRLWDGYPHTSPDLRGEVRKLQALLTARGIPTAIDGYFGKSTETAVKDFQAIIGLLIDGIVGPRTWAALGNKSIGGPQALFETNYAPSNRMLHSDLGESQLYRQEIELAAENCGVDVSVIWGIGSRESRWGLALNPPGPHGTGDTIPRATRRPWRVGVLPHDGGFGRGLMQIDFDAHDFARTGSWKDPARNIAYGSQVLKSCIDLISRRYQKIDRTVILRAGIAGYNCGPGNVLKAIDRGRDIDYYTHGRDYSRDVLSRAGWFQLHGWEK